MKKILPLLVAAWAASVSTAHAQLAYTTNAGQLTVVGYSGGGAVTIPAVSNALPFVSIASGAFQNNSAITSVVIGSNVTSIGSSAFQNCTLLASVSLPNALTNLGASAFQNCTNLPIVTIPGSVSNVSSDTFEYCSALTNVVLGNYVTNITSYAFGYCSSLSNIILDTNLAIIGAEAFYQCGLTNIIIPNSVTNIGTQAFYNCTALVSAGLGDNIIGMGSEAFENCYSLYSVTIPTGVKAIGQYAFDNCSTLASITIPGSITNFGNDAFDYCYTLGSVTLGSGLTSLPNNAFYNCYSLKTITIPDTVTNLSSDAFSECYTLTNAIIGNGVGTIPSGAFSGCEVLTTVTIGNNVTNMSSSSFSGSPALQNIIMANGAKNIFNDQFEDFNALVSVTIPGTVTNIGADAFEYCQSLTSINLPDSVTSIGTSAFQNCESLTSATIGNGVTNIGVDAFENCYALLSAPLGNAVTTIGSGAFENCSALASITIPNTVTNFGSGVFENCYALASTILGRGITTLGSFTFEDCYALTSITIPDSVTNLQSPAVANCPALTNVTIGSGIGTIPSGAFSSCPVLTTVTIGRGVTNMSGSSFSGCPDLANIIIANGASNIFAGEFQYFYSLTTVTIPATVTNISTNAFYQCYSLNSATIPANVTSIGPSAFYQCYALNNLTIPGKVNSIGAEAFYQCSVFTNITIPNSVTNLGQAAFEDCYSVARVNIGSGVTNIGSAAFEFCSALGSVMISGNVTNIGGGAFENCPSLTGVYFEGNAPRPTNDSSVFQSSTPTIYYLAGATGWSPIFDSRPTAMLTPGSLQVTITPSSVVTAGAQWQVDGGVFQSSGATLGNLFPITHIISFSAVSNWATPNDIAAQVSSNQTTSVSQNYVPITGDLQVNITPAAAVTSGATWQVDGGSNQNSGAVLAVQVGTSHTVTFIGASGWAPPADQIITVTNGSTNIITGTYVQSFGNLQVTINPPGAITAGALWQLDGGSNYASRATVNNLPGGSHTVTFLPAPGFLTPASETVLVGGNQTTLTNGTYIPVTNGSLQVTLTPPDAVTAGATWQVDGGSNQISGVTLSNLSGGTHLLSFQPAPGWSPPTTIFVAITNGETTIATGAYTSAAVTGLALLTNGSGTIQHKFSPASVTIGQSYTVKAVPATGNVFVNWVGGTNPPYGVLGADASLTFTMRSNLLVEANFITNLFLAAQGSYAGLFAPESDSRQQTNSGSINFTLTKTGSVSGKLLLGSSTVTLAGKFEADGSAVINSTPHGAAALTTTLQLDVANHAVNGSVTDGAFVAALTGYQNIFSSHQPTANAGAYTLIIPGVDDPTLGPGGISYATVNVSAAGAVSFAGNLADGTTASQSSTLSSGGLWPLYVNLYGGKGSLWGWNYFNSNTVTAASLLSWINETNSSKTAAYRAGFTNQSVNLAGSRYNSSDALPARPAAATLEGGGLPTTITNALTIAAHNKISLTDPAAETNKLTLTVNKNTGVISGSFANPSNAKQTIKINGVILQDQTNASGYFLNNGQSGVFTLGPP